MEIVLYRAVVSESELARSLNKKFDRLTWWMTTPKGLKYFGIHYMKITININNEQSMDYWRKWNYDFKGTYTYGISRNVADNGEEVKTDWYSIGNGYLTENIVSITKYTLS